MKPYNNHTVIAMSPHEVRSQDITGPCDQLGVKSPSTMPAGWIGDILLLTVLQDCLYYTIIWTRAVRGPPARPLFYGILLGPSWLNFPFQRSTIRQRDNAMMTVRQCDDDNATIRWRQYDNTTTTMRQYDDDSATMRQRDNTMTTVRQYDDDNATTRQSDGDNGTLISHCRHRIVALSSSYCHTVVIVLSHCRHRIVALSSSYCRVVALSHCRHRIVALSSSCCRHRIVVIALSRCRIVDLWIE